jgi:hypothetical protein
MTAFELMRRRALEEFDQLVTVRETELRKRLAAAGYTAAEIAEAVAVCQPGLAEQRRGIAVMVMTAFANNDVPLETPAHVWE